MEKIWIYASVGSLIPVIFWIYFWKRQDLNQPEPFKLILKTFIFGVLSIFFALFLQKFFNGFIENENLKYLVFSFFEELAKFMAVFLAALGTIWNNEKRDPMIYMIIGALGFIALENFYYILDFFENSKMIDVLISGSYRFLGASILHIVTSAFVGLFISLVFFKKRYVRVIMAFVGLLIATFIHFIFNIMVLSGDEFLKNLAFYGCWILLFFILLSFQIFEKKEKYRIRRDGVIYYHKKKISLSEKILFKEGEIKKHPDIFKIDKEQLSDSEYEAYDEDNFRKKFY